MSHLIEILTIEVAPHSSRSIQKTILAIKDGQRCLLTANVLSGDGQHVAITLIEGVELSGSVVIQTLSVAVRLQ